MFSQHPLLVIPCLKCWCAEKYLQNQEQFVVINPETIRYADYPKIDKFAYEYLTANLLVLETLISSARKNNNLFLLLW